MLRAALLALLLASPAPIAAHAQSLGDLAGAAESAAETLKSAAADKLLVADMLGAEVTGPGGEAIGTVENLAVVPGGKLVAAILTLENGERLPVPYQMVKVSRAQGKLDIELPVTLEDLRGDEAVNALAAALDL